MKIIIWYVEKLKKQTNEGYIIKNNFDIEIETIEKHSYEEVI